MASPTQRRCLPACQRHLVVGAARYEGRSIVAPVSSANGSAHPFLRVIFDTRVYNDGAARVDVSVENTLDKAGAATVTYDAAITVNGASVFTQAPSSTST